jgi:hypothetical protein
MRLRALGLIAVMAAWFAAASDEDQSAAAQGKLNK